MKPALLRGLHGVDSTVRRACQVERARTTRSAMAQCGAAMERGICKQREIVRLVGQQRGKVSTATHDKLLLHHIRRVRMSLPLGLTCPQRQSVIDSERR